MHAVGLQVDIDNQAVATSVAAAGVASVPTFAFMRGAQRVAQFAGADKRALENNGACALMYGDI